MLKRILITFLAIILIFIVLLYWSVSSTNETYARSIVLQPNISNTQNLEDYDSVLVKASPLYRANPIKHLVQGKQYRKAWASPVSAKVLILDTLAGGVEIIKEGGGNQTHSLKLMDSSKIEYTLRSVNKDPEPLIPDIAKQLSLDNLIIDGISAQHPYGALMVAELADQAGVIHTYPKLVYLPRQKFLKKYNEAYGNRLYLLEYETESKTNWTKLDNIIEIIDTDDLQELKLKLGEKLVIDKRQVIRSRLFDLLIGDWDRHTKQFGWAIQKTNDSLTAIVVSGDRDNAFYNNGGIVPSILSSRYILPRVRPFEKDIDFFEGLVYPFDRYFLLGTDLDLFTSEARILQKLLTDESIDRALKSWPVQISNLDGDSIKEKLKSRRQNLVTYAKQFKDEIDRQGSLDQSLKGSEDKDFPAELMTCFECANN